MKMNKVAKQIQPKFEEDVNLSKENDDIDGRQILTYRTPQRTEAKCLAPSAICYYKNFVNSIISKRSESK
jgi:hypothetical protein